MNKCPWCGSEIESGHTEVSGIGSDCLTLDIWYTVCTSDNCGYYSVSDNPEKTLAVAAMNIANILDVISEDGEEIVREDLLADTISWMVAAKKSHPSLLLPAWVAQWQENRPTPRAADECPVCNGLGDIVKNESIEECPECDGTGIRR